MINPTRICVYDPIAKKPLKYYCVIGDTPSAIVNALDRRALTKVHHATLESRFGPKYKSKLLLSIDGSISGGTLTDDNDDYECCEFEDDEVSGGADGGADGGGVDDDWDNIDFEDFGTISHVEEKKAAALGNKLVEYITELSIQPEDKFSELKDKIHAISGIPAYRQHLYYDLNGRITTTYNLFANGVYDVNMFDIGEYRDFIGGAPIDKKLYNNRDTLRVEALDTFKIIGDLDSMIYITDLNLFPSSQSISRDSYQLDLYYYGFIIKFWPMLTKEIFKKYISSEADMPDDYPDVAKNRSALQQMFKNEAAIVAATRISDIKNIKWAAKNAAFSITQMLAYVDTNAAFDIRNLFDELAASAAVPEIHAYVANAGKIYKLIKRHVNAVDNIVFPPNAVMKSGLTAAIKIDGSLSRQYLFMNVSSRGRVHFRAIWGEEEGHRFDDILRLIKKYAEPIIKRIGDMERAVITKSANSTLAITKAALKYLSLNISYIWKRIIPATTFRSIRARWAPYMQAGIIQHRNVQQMDAFEFFFCKGVHDFDMSKIERIMASVNGTVLFNQYAHLSDNTTKQKWDQNYTGRVVRMMHRTTDIKFDIHDIKEHEFDIFQSYIVAFLADAARAESLSDASVDGASSMRRLKKLREQDPELYNLKKYGSAKVYSAICQNQHQPLIYTPDEVKRLDRREMAKLTKYWNFTSGREAYYACPNKKYPHLSFKVGHHPKHYCLPCCKKIESSENSKKTKINSTCLKEHIYKVTQEDASTSRHVVQYKKDLDMDRLSRLPNVELTHLLNDTLEDGDDTEFLMYGVAQNMPGASDVGLIYALALAEDMRVADYVSALLAKLRKITNTHIVFNSIAGGTVAEHFKSYVDFLNIIQDIFVARKNTLIGGSMDWVRIFTELAYRYMNTTIWTFVDVHGQGESIKLRVGDFGVQRSRTAKNIIVVRRRHETFPIFSINLGDFFRDGDIERMSFTADHPVITLVGDMIASASEEPSVLTLQDIIEAKGGKIAINKLYINRNNLCYAVDATYSKQRCYIPVEYSAYPPTGYELDFDGAPTRYTKLGTALGVIAELGLKVKQYLVMGAKKQTLIGLIIEDNLIFYIADSPMPAQELPARVVQHDYNAVNTLVLAKSPATTDARSERLGNSLYEVYMYKLFIYEFVTHLALERNTAIRERVAEMIESTNFRKQLGEFNEALSHLLADYRADFSIIQSHISTFFSTHFNKKILADSVAAGVYDFDKMTINRLRQLSREEVISELKVICAAFVVDVAKIPHIPVFPNVYLSSCSEGGREYCSKDGKLIVTGLNDMIGVLAGDILHDIRVRNLTDPSFEGAVVDFMKMQRRDNENIYVQLMSDINIHK